MVAPQQPGSAPQQFSVRSLLIAMTLAGFAIVLISTLRIYGGVMLMLVATAATQFVYRDRLAGSLPPPGSNASRVRLWLDLLWGIGIPLMCLLLDPVVLRENTLTLAIDLKSLGIFNDGVRQNWLFAGHLKSYSIPVYTFVAVQMLLLLTKFFGPEVRGRLAAIVGGALSGGGLFASFAAIILAMPATAGLIVFGIGVLGYSPIGAAFVYFPHGLDYYKISRRMLSRLQTDLCFGAGLVGGIAVPLGLGCLLEWLRQSIVD